MEPFGCIYDRTGARIDFITWGELMADRSYAQLGLDIVDGFEISTVWLGIDHFPATQTNDAHLIFETMVSRRDDGDGFCPVERTMYTSEADALVGHAEAVTMVRATAHLYEARALTEE